MVATQRSARDWPQECAAVIPCLNEATGIGELVEGVRRFVPHVLVVDDGSTDGTAAAAAAAGAEVCRHPANRGKGAALRTGLGAARARGFRWALILDGDGQHAADDIPAFWDCVERTGAALVVGDRLSGGLPAGPGHAAMPWVRRQVNRWMTRWLSRLTGTALSDSQCGFRLVDLEAWSGLTLRTDRFEVESEMLVAFLTAGHPLQFVPIRVIYKPHPSKIHPVGDTWRWFKWRLGRRSWVRRVGGLLVGLGLLAVAYGWAAPRAYPPHTRFGFGFGVLHGALMPMALPSLILGEDVEIFAVPNAGRSYKLGYIVGIDLCGLVVFGSAFGQPRRASPRRPKRPCGP